jgi:hypothetical protein
MMDPSNSPGKYDFTTDFYIKHCDLLKKDVWDGIHKFLEAGDMPEIFNSTVLVLILKVKQPQDLAQYQPAMSYVKLHLRFWPWGWGQCGWDYLGRIECAFVPKRLIMDNVLMRCECIHGFNRKKG